MGDFDLIPKVTEPLHPQVDSAQNSRTISVMAFILHRIIILGKGKVKFEDG